MISEFLYSSVIATGAKKLTEKLIDGVFDKSKSSKNIKEDIQSAITGHMEATYEKCFYLKTILRDRRETFSSIYSDQGFTLPNDTRVNQDELISFIKEGNTVVLQGTGGGGKSMFIRYLWLYYFSELRENIPVFIELRNLNSILNNDFDSAALERYVFHSTVSDSGSLSERSFSELLRSGRVVLFLDGFDEINHQHRDACQKAIVTLKEKNPKAIFVVTSRLDERFIGWHQFCNIQVAPLTKEECITLLSKAPFDEDQKKKIIKKVSTTLYETHYSFLSNPLLAYMTLVTYAYNPNFSEKMVQFYELAFDALYYRHDLTKGGGYSRRFYTGLDKIQFQKYLSYFCLRTYYDQKLEYTSQSLHDYLEDIKKIEPSVFQDVNNDLFIRDIMESVCILKKDGVEFTYTHRKFQEYFAAYCISRIASRNLTSMFERFSHRYNDEVLTMVYDLNPDLFREKYIKPLYEKNKKFFELKTEKAIIRRFTELTGYSYELNIHHEIATPRGNTKPKTKNKKSRPRESILIRSSGTLNDMSRALDRLYNRRMIYDYTEEKNIGKDEAFIAECRSETGLHNEPLRITYGNGTLQLNVINPGDEDTSTKVNSKIFERGRDNMFLKSVLEKEALVFHNFVNQELKKFNDVSQAFDEYFG